MHSFQAVILKVAHSRVGNLCGLKNKQTINKTIRKCVVQGSNLAMVCMIYRNPQHCLNSKAKY